jgi:hypothetical protein
MTGDDGRQRERGDPGLEMVTPPYGAYRGCYGNYATAQASGLGAGRLGGWSYATQGGFFDVQHPAEVELAEEHAVAPTEPHDWEEIARQGLRRAA